MGIKIGLGLLTWTGPLKPTWRHIVTHAAHVTLETPVQCFIIIIIIIYDQKLPYTVKYNLHIRFKVHCIIVIIQLNLNSINNN